MIRFEMHTPNENESKMQLQRRQDVSTCMLQTLSGLLLISGQRRTVKKMAADA